jgi:(p)ppGpp synthase/HD superfamily hydrolase
MIYTELTIKAMNLAYSAHHGQFDKGGVPYIFHPIHLAEEMDDEISTCVALLHDTVEDTAVTLEDLEKEFPAEVVNAVRLLTHGEGVDYFDYVCAIRQNPIAVKVKLADLRHNGDPKRICNQGNAEKRRAKYAAARKILTEE